MCNIMHAIIISTTILYFCWKKNYSIFFLNFKELLNFFNCSRTSRKERCISQDSLNSIENSIILFSFQVNSKSRIRFSKNILDFLKKIWKNTIPFKNMRHFIIKQYSNHINHERIISIKQNLENKDQDMSRKTNIFKSINRFMMNEW